MIAHHIDQMYKSLKDPALVKPTRAANRYKTINEMLPPFFNDFLVAIETIPPVNIRIATIIPAEPDTSLFASRALDKPAAHDCSATKANKTQQMMPDTSFHVLILKFHLYCLSI